MPCISADGVFAPAVDDRRRRLQVHFHSLAQEIYDTRQ
jgi:hypothetical protein